MRSDFNKETEVAYIERFNKKLGRDEIKEFPMIGGRLRLFHEDLEKSDSSEIAGGVECEIIQYDGDVAVIRAKVAIGGNAFTGIGMASKGRDNRIYPAILELAETRAIARALRFAGYGIEYTGYEEVNHLAMAAQLGIEQPAEVANDEPVNKPDVKNVSGKSPKRQVWELAKENFPNNSEQVIAANMKIFVANSLKRCEPGTPDEKIYEIAISYPDEFIRSFGALLNPKQKKKELDQTKSKKDYESAKQELSKKLKVSSDDDSARKAQVRAKKAKILMSLPDGVNVNAINKTIEYIAKGNPDVDILSQMDIIANDMDAFVGFMKEFCASEGIDTGLPGDTVDDSFNETISDDKKSYSEFRAQWVNLPFPKFCDFLIKNANEFRKDREEYDAAVEKYDRLKSKHGKEDVCFPYPFDHNEGLSSKTSIIETDYDILQGFREKYPKMCRRVEESTGIPQDCANPKSVEAFMDEFEHLMSSYEAKNGKPYTE